MTSEAENYRRAYDKAVSLIKIRPHFSGEIIRKLTLRNFNADISLQVTQELVRQGLINDEEFAQTFLDNLIRFRTFGFYGLKAKLMRRGLASSEAEALLRENLSVEAEAEIARRVIEKEKQPDKARLMQKLSRKGFRSEVIGRVIRDSSLLDA